MTLAAARCSCSLGSAKRDGLYSALRAVVGQHEPAIVEESRECFALVVRVLERAARVAALTCKQLSLFVDWASPDLMDRFVKLPSLQPTAAASRGV